MSMIAVLQMISDADGAFLRKNPSSIGPFLDGNIPALQVHGNSLPPKKVPFWQGLFQKATSPTRAFDPLDKDARLDLDTLWHGIHFLMTGDSLTPVAGELKPLGFLLYYGTPIDEEDYVYRFLSSEQVATIADALVPLTREGLEKRHVVADFVAADIYPFADSEPTVGENGEDELHDLFLEVLDQFEKLKSFFFTAKQDGRALLVSVS
jgi:hypothetical protein